jgi:hypothetical protein
LEVSITLIIIIIVIIVVVIIIICRIIRNPSLPVTIHDICT